MLLGWNLCNLNNRVFKEKTILVSAISTAIRKEKEGIKAFSRRSSSQRKEFQIYIEYLICLNVVVKSDIKVFPFNVHSHGGVNLKNYPQKIKENCRKFISLVLGKFMTSQESAEVFEMAANKLRLASVKLLELSNYKNVYNPVHRLYCTVQSKEGDSSPKEESQFVKFYKKEVAIKEKLDNPPPKPKDNVTFASLLRNSKFIDLGNPKGKIVIGEIYHVVNDDLYIDFGWKFHTVCLRPKKNQNLYIPGAKVKLMIKDLELSTKFLGSPKEITLLEADCVLLGLADSRSSTE